ncbi:MAG: PEP-CTERM sorting domain-containing protein [Phycisphaerae bacterium]
MKVCIYVCLAAILCAQSLAGAQTIEMTDYGFSVFNDTGWASDNRLNFTVAISDEGQGKVGFVFKNASSISSSITAVYFDDSSLLNSVKDIFNGSGVSFSAGARPRSLPAGNELDPAFAKKPFFAADSDPPTSKNGINPGEWLKITFNLNAGKNFSSVIEQITAGSSKIGIHIQSLPKDDSVSAINNTTPVPEPATVAILSFGSFLVIWKRRK